MSVTNTLKGQPAKFFTSLGEPYYMTPVVNVDRVITGVCTDGYNLLSPSISPALRTLVDKVAEYWVGKPYGLWLSDCVDQNSKGLALDTPFLLEQPDGWYFGDESEQLVGPYESRGRAITMFRVHCIQLDIGGPFPSYPRRYRHRNGAEYTVIALANEHSDRPEYPPQVIYQGDNGRTWSKPLEKFMREMKFIEPVGPVVREHCVTDRGPVTVTLDTSTGKRIEITEALNRRGLALPDLGELHQTDMAELLPYLAYFACTGYLPDPPPKAD